MDRTCLHSSVTRTDPIDDRFDREIVTHKSPPRSYPYCSVQVFHSQNNRVRDEGHAVNSIETVGGRSTHGRC